MNEDSAAQPPPEIDIALATYNGEEFIREQMDSILSQSYGHWRLLCRDDGSTDATLAILRDYARAHPSRVRLVEDNEGNLGFKRNFSRLLEISTAGYVALCDQDDVWLPNRLSACMEAMRELERTHGPAAPLMVHTDLEVVDRELNPVHRSFWRLQGTAPEREFCLNRALVRSGVTGNTVLMNRPLKDLFLPVPPEARAHDWWLALHAAAFGKVAHLATPTVLYRQHDGNAIGAAAVFRFAKLLRGEAWSIRSFSKFLHNLAGTLRQAELFHRRTSGILSADQTRLLEEFLGYPRRGLLRRFRFFWRSRVLPTSPVYWVAYLVLPYFLKPARPS